ncbi:protein kinase domain-containing protein [Sphingobium sp. TomTYG75]|jgi:eukaryotic-like serine/threonine-protein kinase
MIWVGRYRIDELIGEGAMAHVHRAHDPSIDRPIAVKLLKPEFRSDSEITRRFLSESRAAGMLSHANIVTIYDVGEADGTPYIAMEYVDGCPLDELLAAQGRMTADKVTMLGAQIAHALAYAHAQGVVHRDIKPSNILICDSGKTAKLLDFGIARIDGRDVASPQRQAARTQVGAVLGTPRYMSPEQALGIPVDARSDLFSLGVVLYEMVTGKVAFTGAGLATLAIQIAQEQPLEIARQVPDCPKGLRFLIGKLLAKKPDQRFANAAEVAQALRREHDAATGDLGQRQEGWMQRYRMPLLLAASVLLAVGTGVNFVVQREKMVMQDMALTSGSSIASFVARNAALHVAENAGRPAAQQDWAPLQAFAVAAASDPSLRQLVIADERNIIRASSNSRLLGTRYQQTASAEAPLPTIAGSAVTQTQGGIRFVQPVRYAGVPFGKVDVVIERGPLDQAQRTASLLFAGFAVFVTLVLGICSAASVRIWSRPLRRLQRALEDVTAGNLSFRISHRRKDEIGDLFDAMNRMVASMADRQNYVATALADAEHAMLMTRIDPVVAADPAGLKRKS